MGKFIISIQKKFIISFMKLLTTHFKKPSSSRDFRNFQTRIQNGGLQRIHQYPVLGKWYFPQERHFLGHGKIQNVFHEIPRCPFHQKARSWLGNQKFQRKRMQNIASHRIHQKLISTKNSVLHGKNSEPLSMMKFPKGKKTLFLYHGKNW